MNMDPITSDDGAVLQVPQDAGDPANPPPGALAVRPPFDSSESSSDGEDGPSRFRSPGGAHFGG